MQLPVWPSQEMTDSFSPSVHTHKHMHTHTYIQQKNVFHRHTHTSLSAGDCHDNSLGVWSTYDYTLAVGTTLSLPGHQLVWDPHTAYEFVTVGAATSLCFWILEEEAGGNCQLKVCVSICECVSLV